MSQDHKQPLDVGYRIGCFEIESVLGHGGFGIAYKALDTSLRRSVALKEYFPGEFAQRGEDGVSVEPLSAEHAVSYRQGLDLFELEAQTLARFRHPSIVGVGQLFNASNTAYIAMDYEPGDTLHNITRSRGRLSALRVDEIARELLAGLKIVHAQAVTHCDITPKNIIVRRDGSAVMIDFGAARSSWDAGVRTDVMAAYTPSYAPLEVWSTDGDCGPWTDLYSLGAVMFRCMSGHSPPSVEVRQTSEPVADVDQILDALSDDWPKSLVEAVRWMMRIPSDERPQSAEDVLNALNNATGEFLSSPASNRQVGGATLTASSTVTRVRSRRQRAERKPTTVSPEVFVLFKRRIVRLCPDGADFVCSVAESALDETQILDCMAGLRKASTSRVQLLSVANTAAAGTASEATSRAMVLRCLESLVKIGRATAVGG